MPFSSDTRRRLFWITVFTVAMAELEATVVVYLRELYYPDGFAFPLVIIRNRIAAVELGREAATLVMLGGIAMISATDRWRRFAVFMFAFGVWDIFYYVWLYILDRGWPPSLLTWDVLFLIPVPWIGPVLAPVLISIVMILAALAIEQRRDAGHDITVRKWEWVVTFACGLGMIGLFCLDGPAVIDGRMPRPFPWIPFLGLLVLATGVAGRIYRRSL